VSPRFRFLFEKLAPASLISCEAVQMAKPTPSKAAATFWRSHTPLMPRDGAKPTSRATRDPVLKTDRAAGFLPGSAYLRPSEPAGAKVGGVEKVGLIAGLGHPRVKAARAAEAHPLLRNALSDSDPRFEVVSAMDPLNRWLVS